MRGTLALAYVAKGILLDMIQANRTKREIGFSWLKHALHHFHPNHNTARCSGAPSTPLPGTQPTQSIPKQLEANWKGK